MCFYRAPLTFRLLHASRQSGVRVNFVGRAFESDTDPQGCLFGVEGQKARKNRPVGLTLGTYLSWSVLLKEVATCHLISTVHIMQLRWWATPKEIRRDTRNHLPSSAPDTVRRLYHAYIIDSRIRGEDKIRFYEVLIFRYRSLLRGHRHKRMMTCRNSKLQGSKTLEEIKMQWSPSILTNLA